jgi:tRNA (guanosine-2'-O-)-methyltransferase
LPFIIKQVQEVSMRPANRQVLPSDPAKTEKFPRTTRRVERILNVLAHRQPALTVVLENIHDPHNIGAVLRSCDAVGTLAVHTIYTIEERPTRAYARSTSGSASKWIDIFHHESVEACFLHLKSSGFRVLATALADDTQDLYDVDLTVPVAIVFGNEQRGVSDEVLGLADGTIAIPMYGMVESLNISVACAVTIFEAMRQKRDAGHYDTPRLGEEAIAANVDLWIKR